jgi:glycosyltransferase involved in cell wall biosynthesis
MIRVLLISEIPTPYRMPAFERIAAHPDIDLHVLFCAEKEPDRPWEIESHYEFSYEVLPGIAPTLRTRRDTFVYELNPSILGVLRKSPHDVLVVSGYSVFAEQVALLWARVTGRPYVLLSESHLGKVRSSWKQAVKEAVLPRVLRHASAGLATGSAAAAYLSYYGIPPGRIRIFPNTIDVAAYRDAANVARERRPEVLARHGLPDRFILYVGRLVERKGILDLLDAHAALPAEAPRLVVVGDGPLRDEIVRYPRARAVGFVAPQELPQYYGLADLVVVPSHDEPWGVAVNEALAAGAPVVVSDAVGAGPDLVQPGRNGLIYEAGDVGALTRALTAALADLGRPASGGRIDHWDYEFATDQFVEAMALAVSRPAEAHPGDGH